MIEKIRYISREYDNPNKTMLMWYYRNYWDSIYDFGNIKIYIQI